MHISCRLYLEIQYEHDEMINWMLIMFTLYLIVYLYNYPKSALP